MVKLLAVVSAFIGVVVLACLKDLSAATATALFPVHITVVPTCAISATGLEFGVWSYEHGSVAANGSIGIVCERGINYHVSVNAGSHYGPGSHLRQMAGPDLHRLLPYALYKDAGRTQEWGDQNFSNSYPQGTSFPGTGTSRPQTHTVYGSVQGSTDRIPPGSYSDTLLVTVHF